MFLSRLVTVRRGAKITSCFQTATRGEKFTAMINSHTAHWTHEVRLIHHKEFHALASASLSDLPAHKKVYYQLQSGLPRKIKNSSVSTAPKVRSRESSAKMVQGATTMTGTKGHLLKKYVPETKCVLIMTGAASTKKKAHTKLFVKGDLVATTTTGVDVPLCEALKGLLTFRFKNPRL